MHSNFLFRCGLAFALLFALGWSVVVAQDYTVTRTFSGDETLCAQDGTGSVILQGAGAAGGPVTVVERILADPISSITITDISNGGVVEEVQETQDPPGIFDAQRLIESPETPCPTDPNKCGPACGPNNRTVHNGGDSYTSIAETNRDIWEGGDTMEFAYSRFDGNFDVSVRIDELRHPDPTTCWGKYGLMARQTLDHDSRMASIQNHGPCREPGNSTSMIGRPNHQVTGAGTTFEDISGDGAFLEYPYLRLTRRGTTLSGWGSMDSDVESDPTEDSLWEKIGRDVDTTADTTCWYVGFCNSEIHIGGCDIQEVDFTIVRFEGTSCFDPATEPPIASADLPFFKRVTWTDVPRADVNNGLSYTISAPGAVGNVVATDHRGTFDGGNDIGGTPSGSLTAVQQVGDLSARPVGDGGGSAEFDGTLYEVSGTGSNIWNGGDHMNFVYQKVTGDFDATAFMVDKGQPDSPESWGKYGVMSRQSCEPISQYDFMMAFDDADDSNLSVLVPRFAVRNRDELPDIWNNEAYQVQENLPGRPPSTETIQPDPDFFRLIRTGSQVTGYISWVDPDNFGQPLHWSAVGSRNAQDRTDDLFVGVATNMVGGASELTFTWNVQPYAPEALDDLEPGAVVFERNFDTDPNGESPSGAFTGTRGSDGGLGTYAPRVVDGRLRMSDETVSDAATSVFFVDNALNDLLETGFVAEYDARVTKEGLAEEAGEGGMFVVVASATDLLSATPCTGAGPVLESFDNIGTIIGEDLGGDSGSSVDNSGTPDNSADDIYTNVNSSGGDIWNDCDAFTFDYTPVSGDFDIAIEILAQEHDSGRGAWGKQGIMAREGITDSARHVMVNDTFPDDTNPQPSWVTGRRNTTDCAGSFEIPTGIVHPPYLRLTRRGNTIQGWIGTNPGLGDGTLDPHNDCNWTPGHAETPPEGLDFSEELFVGVANSDHNSAGSVAQTIVYRILQPNPGGSFEDKSLQTDLVGYPREMGFGHLEHNVGSGGEDACPTHGLRAITEGRPMFAVEIDTRVTPDEHGGGKANEGAGAPENTGQYHIGLNVEAISHSRQTNEQHGVDAEDLPDIFAGDVHFKVEYRPNGEIEVFVSSASAEGAPIETKVIDTYIPPLTLGDGLFNPVVGFVGSTIVGGTQTLEFDNLTIRPLGSSSVGGFRRGDCDQSGKVDFNDAIFHLRFLFLGENESVVNSCKDACDSDDSGSDDFTDDINILKVLFLGQGAIPAPGPLPDETHPCGADPTADGAEELGCDAYEPTIACP